MWKTINKKKCIVISIIVLLLLIFGWYQNNHIVLSMYKIESENTPKAFDGYRIVQVSDLHNKSFGKNNKRLCEKIESLNPDVIVITGDIVDSNHTNIDVAKSFVSKIKLIAPVYYVNGNHEYWLDEKDRLELYNELQNAGAIILDNQVVKIEKDNESINLIGLNEKSLSDDTLRTLASESHGYSVLLAHEPQCTDSYSVYVDLALTGHAHGGQIRLPFLGPLVAPDQGWLPKYTSGIYEVSGKEYKMVVSRGLGNSIIPIRIFNYPEVVCVEL